MRLKNILPCTVMLPVGGLGAECAFVQRQIERSDLSGPSPGVKEKSILMFVKDCREGDFLGGPVVKNPPSNAGDMGSVPGQGNSDPTCRRATKSTLQLLSPYDS